MVKTQNQYIGDDKDELSFISDTLPTQKTYS